MRFCSSGVAALLVTFAIGCNESPSQAPPPISDASLGAAKQAQDQAMKQLAEANEALGMAAAAVQAALGKDVAAAEERANAAKTKLASKDAKTRTAAQATLDKAEATASAAKLAVAKLETARAAQIQELRSQAQEALKAFQAATVELEALAGIQADASAP